MKKYENLYLYLLALKFGRTQPFLRESHKKKTHANS